MPKSTKPALSIIGASPASEVLPPPDLDEVGGQLWREVAGRYVFDDPASTEVLRLACLARQRAARCATQITADGELIRIGKGVRSHPLLRDEATFTALCARLLQRLGLDLCRCGPVLAVRRGAEMPTKRRKIGAEAINQPTPDWAVRLIAEHVAPREGEDGFDEWFDWLFCSAPVAGLPDADSDAGRCLWSDALKRARDCRVSPRRRTSRTKPVGAAGARQKPTQRRGAAGP